ncbi:MAG: outer membrane beta-barrel domain-containing protein [Bdellovibrionales bacterium CG10_big_fil_rev_8_21_14_0_10_45_34]|nr:MAG: outer membrane beta-barrel domain-containing protein [Bdellovibrionales bacterium CG10_big_fil_rev_8_21_14_0_10_45_34]
MKAFKKIGFLVIAFSLGFAFDWSPEGGSSLNWTNAHAARKSKKSVAKSARKARGSSVSKSKSVRKSEDAPVSYKLNTLGDNNEFLERAQALDSRQKVRVVQNRLVDRNLRLELGINGAFVSNSDSYVDTKLWGASADFHIIPQISLGVRYASYNNSLTPEGRRQFDEAVRRQAIGDDYIRPDVDFPLSSTMGVVTFSPLYGKLNFFNLGVTQFDIYGLAGYGQMTLNSGASNTWTAGGGVGVWWNNTFTSRVEVKHQSYEDQIISGTRTQGTVHFSLGVGVLL